MCIVPRALIGYSGTMTKLGLLMHLASMTIWATDFFGEKAAASER